MVCDARSALAFLSTLRSSDSLGFVGVILLLKVSYYMVLLIGRTAGGEVS
jgi:hypothetical protein